MPDKDILFNVAFFVGSIIAVVIAYFRKPGGKSTPDPVSITAGFGTGFVSKEAEERRDELFRRQAIAQESMAASLAVLADRERHEQAERVEDGFERIEELLKRLPKSPDG
ncbi:hypothetical protein [Aureimonas leprariae]|uniref:Uncharacterized protein n=1 Tax=Plantimonas leprariae TaxID=2615207 RepID=A0A7V7PSE8_9HYPH|nr:hypothetical protein [Aureimonas leprariae]KAB0682005.1 hypothetical protein F6X38_04150 [Aureimonas leprariae]